MSKKLSLIESALISKLNIGDGLAFSDIFTAYYQDLVLFASRYTSDLNDSEEIVQNAFLLLWEEHESIKINSSLKAYLLKIVQNKCIDWYRHKKIIDAHSKAVIDSSVPFEESTDNYILHSELQEQVEIALGMLPENIAEVFRMNRYKGLKYHEIAKILDVSERTIEVRIGKALHLLRHYLKEYFVAD